MKSPNGRPRQTRLDRIALDFLHCHPKPLFPSAAVTVSRPDPAVCRSPLEDHRHDGIDR